VRAERGTEGAESKRAVPTAGRPYSDPLRHAQYGQL